AAPVIVAPTDAGHPIVLDAQTTAVSGRAASRQQTVSLSIDDTVVAATETLPLFARQASWFLSPNGGILSPDGREMAHPVFDGSGYRVRLSRIYGGSFRDLASTSGNFPTLRAFSRDGRRLAYLSGNQMRVVDVTTGVV